MNTNTTHLILASASPRRHELLQKLGVPFTVVPPDVPEYSARHTHLAPREICLANAGAKARAVAQDHPESLVLGADTEVALDTRVFGKPKSQREASSFLRSLSGQTHQVITGVCLLCLHRHIRLSFTEVTQVTFHPLSPKDIQRYVQAVNTLDKAGAYAIQEHGDWLIERLDGSLSNVIGLPIAALRHALDRILNPVTPRP